MATHFVDSAASGANNGTSWTDAWTSLASSNNVAAGDTVKVDDGHSQTGLSASINWSNGTVAAPVIIICVDKNNSDALSTGALVRWGTNNTGPQGSIYARGMTWSGSAAAAAPLCTTPVNGMQIHENCTFTLTGAGNIAPNAGNAGTKVRWINCNVDLSGASAVGAIVNFGVSVGSWEWYGGTYTCRATQTSLFFGATTSPHFDCRGVTFSGTVTNLITSTASTSFHGCRFVGCVLPTYTNVVSTALFNGDDRITFEGTVAGTLTVAMLQPTFMYDGSAILTPTTSKYRTGGADDGEQANAYSWEIAGTSAIADFHSWFESPWMVARIAAGASQTVTVYVASEVTLQDNEFWVEVISPSEAGSPTALVRFQTTRPTVVATPGDLTTDGSSTWNGTGVTTKQKITVTISPTIAGEVRVRAFLAKASTTVYVDPKLEIA
jgi:hypothetical protein